MGGKLGNRSCVEIVKIQVTEVNRDGWPSSSEQMVERAFLFF